MRYIRWCISLSLLLLLPVTLPAQQSAPDGALIGTWTLTDASRVDSEEDDDAERPRTRGARGVLILDGAGNVFEYFSIGSGGRSADEPEFNLGNVGGFWGRYAVEPEAGSLVFSSKDGVSPNVSDLDFARQYELDGDQLVITSADEPDAQGHMRWTWQRTPVVENLSPTYRNVIGFWQHVEEGQVTEGSTEIEEPRHRAPSVIVYTPSGFVGVHFPTQGREAPTAADDNALRGYLGYFGTLNVYPGEVSHNVLSGVSPGTGSILRRYAAINDDELVVRLQSLNNSGDSDEPRTATIVRLKRLSGAEDMLGQAQ